MNKTFRVRLKMWVYSSSNQINSHDTSFFVVIFAYILHVSRKYHSIKISVVYSLGVDVTPRMLVNKLYCVNCCPGTGRHIFVKYTE